MRNERLLMPRLGYVLLGWITVSSLTACHVVRHLFSGAKANPSTTVSPAVSSTPTTSASAEKMMDTRYWYDQLKEHTLQFQTYAARMKVNYIHGDEQQNAVVNLRIRSDSLIWLNATALLGIEVVRALVTPDSITVLNRLKHEYYQKSFADISKWLRFPVNFHMLQNLLVGNPLFLSPLITHLQYDSTTMQLTMQVDSLVNQLWLAMPTGSWQKSLLRVQHSFTSVVDSSGDEAVIEYVYRPGSASSPQGWQLIVPDSAHAEQRLRLDVQVQAILLNQPLSFPFAIPAHYTKL